MKTHATFALFVALLASAAVHPTFAASAPKPAFAHPVSAVECSGGASIVRGNPVAEVWLTLGNPAEELGRDVWVYPGFNGGAAQARHDDCSTLVITFVHGRVSDLQLVNNPALALLAERKAAKKNPGALTVAGQ